MVRFWLVFLVVLYCTSNIYAKPTKAKRFLTSTSTKGWYWRDLPTCPADLPDDALPGGKDVEGETTYIAQVVHYPGETLIPGVYVPKKNSVYYNYDSIRWNTKNNVKILCTQEPENFEWINVVKNDPVVRNQSYVLVRGGSEKEQKIAVGRFKFHDEIIQGKVIIERDNVFGLLLYNKHDGAGDSLSRYEVLYYVKSDEEGNSNSVTTTDINNGGSTFETITDFNNGSSNSVTTTDINNGGSNSKTKTNFNN